MKMSIGQHRTERRYRSRYVLFGLCFIGGVLFEWGDEVMLRLVSPLLDGVEIGYKMQLGDPTEVFRLVIWNSVLGSFFIGYPLLRVQRYRRVVGGRRMHEERVLRRRILFSCVFGVVGRVVGNFVRRPLMLEFLDGFSRATMSEEVMEGAPRISLYRDLLLQGFILRILRSQVPVRIWYRMEQGYFSINLDEGRIRYRRLGLRRCLVVGALVTPPDVLSQRMVGGSMYRIGERVLFGMCLNFGLSSLE